MDSKWIKLNDQLPENTARKVRFEYLDVDGSVTELGLVTTGHVLNKYVALYGVEALPTKESSITVWQYVDPDPSGNGHEHTV